MTAIELFLLMVRAMRAPRSIVLPDCLIFSAALEVNSS